MTPNEYQTLAARTLIDKPEQEIPDEQLSMVYRAVQIAEAAGNLAEFIKKGVFHRHGLNENVIKYNLERLNYSMENFFIKKRLIGFKLNSFKMLFWNVIGLIGEAGEIAGLASHWLVNGEYDEEKFIKELGDCLWYLSAICTKLNVPLEEVMETNIEKLKTRYPDGFSSEASINRDGKQSQ